MRSYLTILVLASTTINVAAAESVYELPSDGWYQLQSATNFEEICTSSTPELCLVAEGESYWLINHSKPSNSAEHRQQVVASSGSSNNALSNIIRVQNDCNLGRGATVDGFASSCLVSCPVGGVLIGVVECAALYTVGTYDDYIATSFTSDVSSVSCMLSDRDEREWNLNPLGGESVRMSVAAMCAMK